MFMNTDTIEIYSGSPQPLGLSVQQEMVNFAVCAPAATALWLCFFDAAGQQIAQYQLPEQTDGVWHGALPLAELSLKLPPNDWHYGLRADGPYDLNESQFFDPNKLLIDPYAKELSAPFVYHTDLAAPRDAQIDTANLMPKAVFRRAWTDAPAPEFSPVSIAPKFIYEVSVKALTELHPDVPESVRGTIAALREPCVIAHLQALGVDAAELMPIAAWIDERHLPPLGLRNAWGYNPVAMMAVEPRLCPNGVADVQETVRVLHEAGIAVILDVVFNHTGESDELGATLSMRGLDNRYYFRHAWDEARARWYLVNDTGCGNTIDCTRAGVVQLMLDTLRYFVTQIGVAGFRFDLAPILGRDAQGFNPLAPLLTAIEHDAILSNAWLIAEPWDIGQNGYQLGQFSPRWSEWNDRYRDSVRRFWRGDAGMVAEFATRIAGSSDVFLNGAHTRSVNFIAAHDGMSVRDLVSYESKHNHANGEDNRDGHNENYSWNHGVEGVASTEIEALRTRDVAAMLATLLLSRGTPMLMAGDEFGRTQQGNNNAYAQDNAITWLTWLNWADADEALCTFVGQVAQLRARLPVLNTLGWLNDDNDSNVQASWWRGDDAHSMNAQDWQNPMRHHIGLQLECPVDKTLHGQTGRVLLWFNAHAQDICVQIPAARANAHWRLMVDSHQMKVWQSDAQAVLGDANPQTIPARSVQMWIEYG
jgi:glycogen operon protein